MVVIGNFDGVHLGHQALLEFAAKQRPDQPLVAVTFEPHTMAVVRPQAAPARLTPAAFKEQLLRQHGVADVVVVPFDTGVSSWAPDEFVARVLAPLQPSVLVVGEGFRFGHRAAGTVDTLIAARTHYDFDVTVLALVERETASGPAAVSSSLIRARLADGEVEAAAGMLGRDHRVSGTVVPGDRRGRALLGFPTANLPADPGVAVPADGVYAGWLTRVDDPGKPMPAAISVGTNPTFNGVQRRVESYVLDRDDLELYGVAVDVDFSCRIRGQITFDSIEPLIEQMHADVDRARALLTP